MAIYRLIIVLVLEIAGLCGCALTTTNAQVDPPPTAPANQATTAAPNPRAYDCAASWAEFERLENLCAGDVADHRCLEYPAPRSKSPGCKNCRAQWAKLREYSDQCQLRTPEGAIR